MKEIDCNMANIVILWCCNDHKKERYDDVTLRLANTINDDACGYIIDCELNPKPHSCSYNPVRKNEVD